MPVRAAASVGFGRTSFVLRTQVKRISALVSSVPPSPAARTSQVALEMGPDTFFLR